MKWTRKVQIVAIFSSQCLLVEHNFSFFNRHWITMYSTNTKRQINYLITCKYKLIQRNICWCNWEKVWEENFLTSILIFCAVLRKCGCDGRWILHVLDWTELYLMALVLRPNWKITIESSYKCKMGGKCCLSQNFLKNDSVS